MTDMTVNASVGSARPARIPLTRSGRPATVISSPILSPKLPAILSPTRTSRESSAGHAPETFHRGYVDRTPVTNLSVPKERCLAK